MKSKCENEAKKQDAVRDMTHEILLIYFKENYVQKDLEKREKQVKKNDGRASNDGDASTGSLKVCSFEPESSSTSQLSHPQWVWL